MTCNMKTVAVSIDEPTLEQALRRVASAGGGVGRRGGSGKGGGGRSKNFSQFVREALREKLARAQREEGEQRDREALHRHRVLLGRQARALVARQA